MIICICIFLEVGIRKKEICEAIMVYVKRKENETGGAMLRRFTRRVQLSGVLISARKGRSYSARPTRRAVRDAALRRLARRKTRERLEKLGKASERKRLPGAGRHES